jgi:hypothetical protein
MQMKKSDDEKGSPLRRKMPEANNPDDGDATKRSLNMNEMADIEQHLSEKGIKTVDERIEYLKNIDPDNIDSDLEKRGIKSAADRDKMVQAEESLKAIWPIIASSRALQAAAEIGPIVANAPAIRAAQELGRIVNDPVLQANARIVAEMDSIIKNSGAIQTAATLASFSENNPALQANAQIAAAMQHYSAEIAKFSSTLQDIANIRSTHLNIPAAVNQAKDNPAMPNKSLLEDRSRPFLPNLDFPELPEIEPIFPKMEENQWNRHNQLLDSQNQQLESLRDTYRILAVNAKTNQDILDEQRRTNRVTWAVLGAGVAATFGIPLSVISQNWSLISDPRAIGALLMLGLAWAVVIAFLMRGPPKRSKQTNM